MADLIASASRVPGLELELMTDTQYATAYLDGRPFATVRRRHAFDPAGSPRWQVWVGNDSIPFRCALPVTVVRHVERMARIELGLGERAASDWSVPLPRA